MSCLSSITKFDFKPSFEGQGQERCGSIGQGSDPSSIFAKGFMAGVQAVTGDQGGGSERKPDILSSILGGIA